MECDECTRSSIEHFQRAKEKRRKGINGKKKSGVCVCVCSISSILAFPILTSKLFARLYGGPAYRSGGHHLQIAWHQASVEAFQTFTPPHLRTSINYSTI